MGKLGNIGKLMMRVNGNDHYPAHFHVVGPDIDAQVTFHPLMVIRGDLPGSLREQVFAWAMENHERLILEWNRCNPHLPIPGGKA